VRLEIVPGSVKEPDYLLDDNGVMRLLPAARLDAIPNQALRMWCHNHARYGLPTAELIEWLQFFVKSYKAIEIGSGCGDLAFHLGIPATDSRMQERPEIRAWYDFLQHPAVVCPPFVETLDATQAIAKYKPDLVIASWVTQWSEEGDDGNPFGVVEELIPACGVTYLFIGHPRVHGRKRIMRLRHEEYRLPFLRSRATDQSQNTVYIWRPQ
jgi:hypothetical protein